MRNAIQAKVPVSKRQRCITHNIDTMLSDVPKKQQEPIRAELQAIFCQTNRQKADELAAACCLQSEGSSPAAIQSMRNDWQACLTVDDFAQEPWQDLRTTHSIERLCGAVKKRSHKMEAAFRNANSCLLMVYVVIRSLKFRHIPIPASQTETPGILHNS